MSHRYRFIPVFGFFLGVLGSLVFSHPAGATSLQIAPLIYRQTLKANDVKKGFVDVSNPSTESLEIQLQVKSFRQTNNQGALQFYDNPALTQGIKLDLNDVTLGPHEALRVFFQLNASKLPPGDVFAAILARPIVPSGIVTIPTVQVGTLLLLENASTPPHSATISSADIAWFQFGDAITAKLQLTNTDPPGGSAIGFIPSLQVSVGPYSQRVFDGPLLFAGISREVDFYQPGDYFGPLLMKFSVAGHTKQQWLFVITGYWQWLAPLLLVLLVFGLTALTRWRRLKHPKTVEK